MKSPAGDSDESLPPETDISVGSAPPPPAAKGLQDQTEIINEESSSQLSQPSNQLKVKIPPEDYVAVNILNSPVQTPRKVNFSPTPSPNLVKANGSPGSSSSKGKSAMKLSLPRLSFKFRNPNSELEKAAILALGDSRELGGKKSSPRTISLIKLFSPMINRTSSLPETPILHSNPESSHGGAVDVAKGANISSIHRSQSVPVLIKDGSLKAGYLGSVYRVLPVTPCNSNQNTVTSNQDPSLATDDISNYGEDIPEEEAVCRICLVELGESSDTLKMECSCKGALALAHQECAVKWFSLKGNKTCDVCNQDVKNLPVTLLKIQNAQTQGDASQPNELPRYRVWQDVPILVIVSMLAYFCFLEQILVTKMGAGAISISLPFSCILGLLASMTSTTMVQRGYAWLYAGVQFSLVILFAHVFYTLLHLQAVLSILMATFTGFGGAMCGTSIFVEIRRWRRARRPPIPQQSPVQPEHNPQSSPPVQRETP